jgi:predicted permease
VLNDIRFGLRMLRRDPAFTAVAVLTLALGIGANTAIFTLFDAILLQSLPVRDPTRLVLFSDSRSEGTFTGSAPGGRWTLFSFESFEFLNRQKLPFDAIAAVRSGQAPISIRVSNASQAERAQAQLVSGSYFRVMGVDAARGRLFGPEDDRVSAAPVAVVSNPFWTERLHSDPRAIGSVTMVNGMAFTIVGVTPREFFGERVRRPPDFWIPLVFHPQVEVRPSYLERTDSYWLNLIARLAPGVTPREAQTAATTALQQFLIGKEDNAISDERRRDIRESRIELADGAAGISNLRFRYSEPLHVLLGVVALVLLLACANVGNLLLSRAAARETEITVRMALGVGRARLVRQLLTESVLLAVLGAAGGVLLARWMVSTLLALMVTRGSPVQGTLDGSVLAFTMAVTAVAGVAFGLVPALSAGRFDLVSALKARGRGAAAGRGRRGFTRTLVVAQIAISLVLLVGANLFARSLINLEGRPLGFDADRVLLARVNPRLAGYTPTNVTDLYRRLFERVNAVPGIRSATIARYSPLGGGRSMNSGVVEGYSPKADENVRFETVQVGPAYPETLGMALLQGRAIGVEDVAGSTRVGMVNSAFVRRYLPAVNPIGRHFGVSGSRQIADVEIVGVLGDARFQDADTDVEPTVFVALLQEQSQFALDAEVEVRAVGDPAAVANVVRRAIAEVDPNLPINDTNTLRAQVAANFDSQRLAARLVGFFGALALLLACVGLYGVVTQNVVRRTSEIGVRMALGAERNDVVWMILREVLTLVGLGLLIGVPVALASMRAVASQIYGLQSAAPASFAIAIAVLAVIAAATGFVPARKASRLDPLVALRDE